MVSGAIVAISIGSLAIRQLNAGLEFRGGTAFEVESKSDADVADVRAALEDAGIREATVQQLGDRGFLIETRHLGRSAQDRAVAALVEVTKTERNDVNVQDVGPKWGRQITNKAFQALLIFLAVAVIYMSIRLEPKMAGTAMLALVHDLVITAGIYSLTGFVVTPATIIALLTVLGYSLYDTVVIFDRVKDRTATLSAAGNITYTEAANQSVNQVLVRSLNTSITSLLPVGSLLFVGSLLLGAQTLRELALALFIGLSVGTYSSIFLATPVLASWKEREQRWTTLRTRIAARGADVSVPRPPVATPPAAPPRAPASRPADVATTVAEPQPSEIRPPARSTSSAGRTRRRKKRKRRKR
jgi:preprotein translocase subunit SecF